MTKKLPTIELKRKNKETGREYVIGKYVMVKDRIIAFNELYPNGKIQTQIVSDNENKIVMKAIITPDVDKFDRCFTGYSASNPAKYIEKVSPHEVAETSAVGRALAFMGIGIVDSVASADEIIKSADSGIKSATIKPKEIATPKQMELLKTKASDIIGGSNFSDVLILINDTLGTEFRDELDITKDIASKTLNKLLK